MEFLNEFRVNISDLKENDLLNYLKKMSKFLKFLNQFM